MIFILLFGLVIGRIEVFKELDLFGVSNVQVIEPYNLMVGVLNDQELVTFQWVLEQNMTFQSRIEIQKSVYVRTDQELIFNIEQNGFGCYQLDSSSYQLRQMYRVENIELIQFVVPLRQYGLLLVICNDELSVLYENGTLIVTVNNEFSQNIVSYSLYYRPDQVITQSPRCGMNVWEISNESISHIDYIDAQPFAVLKYLSIYQTFLTIRNSNNGFSVGLINVKLEVQHYQEIASFENENYVDYALDYSQIFLHILTNKQIISWSLMTRLNYSSYSMESATQLIPIPNSFLFVSIQNYTHYTFFMHFRCDFDKTISLIGTCVSCPPQQLDQCQPCYQNILLDDVCAQCKMIDTCLYCANQQFSGLNYLASGLCVTSCPSTFQTHSNATCMPPCHQNQIYHNNLCYQCDHFIPNCLLCDKTSCLRCQQHYMLNAGHCTIIQRPNWLKVNQVIHTIHPQTGFPIVGLLFTFKLHPSIPITIHSPVQLLFNSSAINHATLYNYSNRAIAFLLHPNQSLSSLALQIHIPQPSLLFSSKSVPFYPLAQNHFAFNITHLHHQTSSLLTSIRDTIDQLQGLSYLPVSQNQKLFNTLSKTSFFTSIVPSLQRYFALYLIDLPKPPIPSEFLRLISLFSAHNHILPHQANYYYSYFKLHNDDVSKIVTQTEHPYFRRAGMPSDFVYNAYIFCIVLLFILVGYFLKRFSLFQLQQSFDTQIPSISLYAKNQSINELIFNWTDYKKETEHRTFYEDEALYTDSLCNFALLTVIQSYFTILFISLLLWIIQMKFTTTFTTLSSTLLIVFLIIILFVYIQILVKYYMAIRKLNQIQEVFITVQNTLKRLYTAHGEMVYLKVNENLMSILKISELAEPKQRYDSLEELTLGDKLLMHTYIKHIQYVQAQREFVSKYFFLAYDLRIPQVDSLFNYENDLKLEKIQQLFTLNKISNKESVAQPYSYFIMSYHIMTLAKKFAYTLTVVYFPSFYVIIGIEIAYLLLKCVIRPFRGVLMLIFSIGESVFYIVGLVFLLLGSRVAEGFKESVITDDQNTRADIFGLICVIFFILSMVMVLMERGVKGYIGYDRLMYIRCGQRFPDYFYPDSEMEEIQEYLRNNNDRNAQIQTKQPEVVKQEEPCVGGRLNFPDLEMAQNHVLKIEYKVYDVSFCGDSTLEFEIYILVSLLDKRIAMWDARGQQQELQQYLTLRNRFIGILQKCIDTKNEERLKRIVNHLKSTNIYDKLEYEDCYNDFD